MSGFSAGKDGTSTPAPATRNVWREGGSPTDTLQPLIWSPTAAHQHSTQPITRGKLTMELRVVHPMVPPVTIGRWSDLAPSLASKESVQRLTSDLTSQNKTTELLEVVAAIVVTACLVAGNLLLFTPLRLDNRFRAPAPPAQTENTARPVCW